MNNYSIEFSLEVVEDEDLLVNNTTYVVMEKMTKIRVSDDTTVMRIMKLL